MSEYEQNKISVFISYAREDKNFVFDLKTRLENNNVNCYGDWDLIAATKFETKLKEDNLAATMFLFIISPDSITSNECKKEIALAVENKKVILPVSYRDHIDDNLLDSAIRTPQWVFLRTEDDLKLGILEILEALKTDFDLLDTHSRLLLNVDEWIKKNRNSSYLLKKYQLKEAEEWLQRTAVQPDKLPQPTSIQVEFIVASQRSRTKSTRRLLAISLVAIIILISISIYAWISKEEAVKQKGIVQNQLFLTYWNNSQSARTGNNFLNSVFYTGEALALTNDESLRRTLLQDVNASLPNIRLQNVIKINSNISALMEMSPDGTKLIVLNQSGDYFDPRGYSDSEPDDNMEVDNLTHLYDVSSGEDLVKPARLGNIISVSFSSNGKKILINKAESSFLVDSKTLKKHGSEIITDPEGMIPVFSKSGEKVLMWLSETTIRVFDTANLKKLYDSAFSSKKIDSAFLFKSIGVVNESKIRPPDSLGYLFQKDPDGINGAIIKFRLNVDFTKQLCLCSDSSARVFDRRTWKQLGETIKNNNFDHLFTTIDLSPDGKTIAIGSTDGTVNFYNAMNNSYISSIRLNSAISQIHFTSDNKHLLTLSLDSSLAIWNFINDVPKSIHSMQIKDTFPGIFYATLSPNESKLIVLNSQQDARIIDLDKGLKTIDRIWDMGNGSFFRSINFSPDGKKIITAADNGSAQIYSAMTYKEIKPGIMLDDIISCALYSPDEKEIMTATQGGDFNIWDSHTLKKIDSFKINPEKFQNGDVIGTKFCFHPSGNILAVYSGLTNLNLIDAKTGTQIGAPFKHEYQVTSASFSPSGDQIITVTINNCLHIWDVKSRKPICKPLYIQGLFCAIFTPKGSYMCVSKNGGITLLEPEGDLDIPTDLFTIQAKALTGTEFFTKNGEAVLLPIDKWRVLKSEYEKKAKAHYMVCRYQKYNLWKRYQQ